MIYTPLMESKVTSSLYDLLDKYNFRLVSLSDKNGYHLLDYNAPSEFRNRFRSWKFSTINDAEKFMIILDKERNRVNG